MKEGSERTEIEDGEGYRPRVVVKFHDHIDLPYEDGVEKYFNEYKIESWEALKVEFPGITFRRLYTALSTDKINDLINKATELDANYRPKNFFKSFIVESPPGTDPEELVRALSTWETVEKAYFDPPGSEPSVNPADDPRSVNQRYLNPAPTGIDARFAWTVPGGDGTGVRVIDLERGWTFNHDDLVAHGATLLHGTIRDGSRAHGTAVLGEISAVDNTIGCIGIAPNLASINAVSYWGSNRPDAIMAAIANLSYGDVLILEAQLSIASWSNMPIEVLDAEFNAIRLATALGIVVIEAAGNGSNDLDTYVDGSGNAIFNRASAGFRDSGAIMVGAASSASPHTRMSFSNYGSRVDCYAWGENVDTCYSNSAGSTTLYTGTFNGTSSASPIVAGAAVIIQSIAEAGLGNRFHPFQLRTILSDSANGTPSINPVNDRIGVMPDLRKTIPTLSDVRPDERRCSLLGISTALLLALFLIRIGTMPGGFQPPVDLPVYILFLAVSIYWIRVCRPGECRILIVAILGFGLGALILLLLALQGGYTPRLLNVLIVSIIMAVAAALQAWRRNCIPLAQ